MKNMKKAAGKEEGQTLVEFALVFPLLLFLALGIIEFSWIYLAKLTVNDASRETARIYAITGNESRSVEEGENMTTHLTFLPDHPRAITISPSENDMAKVVFQGHIRPLVGFFIKAEEGADVYLETVMRMEPDLSSAAGNLQSSLP